MRWEDERYVRIYTRDTPEWSLLSWEARAVFYELMRKVDRAGVLAIGRSGLRGVAGLLRFPLEVVERGLAELVDDGCVVRNQDAIVVLNFIEAQEAKQSDRQRKAEQRARDRANRLESGQGVTNRDSESQNVTQSHELSREVTDSHELSQMVTPCLAVLSRAEDLPVVPHDEPEPPPVSEPVLTPAEPASSKRAKRSKPRTSALAFDDPSLAAWVVSQKLPALDSNDGAEVAKMLDYHRARGTLAADWAATWRTWLAKASEFGRALAFGPAPGFQAAPLAPVPEPAPPPPPTFIRGDPPEPARNVSQLLAIASGGSK